MLKAESDDLSKMEVRQVAHMIPKSGRGRMAFKVKRGRRIGTELLKFLASQ